MATRSVIESDISGKPEASTVTFGLGSTWYEIDLTDEEQRKLEEALKTYLKAGRKAATKQPSKRFVPDTTPEDRDKIRAWAREQGYEFASYGKIPNKIYEAYQEAHSDDED